MSRALNMKNMKMMKFSELSFFVIKFEIRRLNKIWNDLTFIFKLRVISFLIFLIMTIFLWIKWDSENVASWLWAESTTFKIQMLVSFFRVAVQDKKYFMRLLLKCLRCWSVESSDFLLQSQTNYVFRRSFSFDFLMRSKTTAYSWKAACSLTRNIKSSKFSK